MKVVIIGDSQVGKTCILGRLTAGRFNPESMPTIGAAFQNHTLATAAGIVSLQIWDTAGQERYRSLAPMYYRNAQAAIVVFDLTSLQSFQSLDQWRADLEGKRAADLRLFVVGNKADLVDRRVVEKQCALEFAARCGAVEYIETSAKSGQGITDLFKKVAESIAAVPLHRLAMEEQKRVEQEARCHC
jgi:small GTP-binding protein